MIKVRAIMIRVVLIIAIPNSQSLKIESTAKALCIRINEMLVPEPIMAPVAQILIALLTRGSARNNLDLAFLGCVKLRVQLHHRC